MAIIRKKFQNIQKKKRNATTKILTKLILVKNVEYYSNNSKSKQFHWGKNYEFYTKTCFL